MTNSSDHVVRTGRWAYTPVLLDRARAFSNVTNAYGLLRSPWNTNPEPYVMRSRVTLGRLSDGYDHFPTCANFSSFLTGSGWLGQMLFGLNGFLHGPVHIMVGGHWSFDRAAWEPIARHMQSMDGMLLLSKFLWRQGYVRCPETCDAATTPARDCACACPAALVRGREDAVLAEAGVWDLSSLVGLSTALAHENVSTAELLGLLCEVGHPGEMFTSAAPQDPLFWPVHGLAERFLQYARVLKRRGELDFSEAWGYFHAPSLPSDTGVVCDWSGVRPGSMERPACARATCPGHRLHDVLPFDDLVLGDASRNASATADRKYTNAQFYELIDPVSGALPYVYDTLAHWPACPGGTLL